MRSRQIIIEFDSFLAVNKINGILISNDLLFQVLTACKELITFGIVGIDHTSIDYLASFAFQSFLDLLNLTILQATFIGRFKMTFYSAA